MQAPLRTKSHSRPTYVVVMWLTSHGVWQGRIKALSDGQERMVPDMHDLLAVVETLKEEQDAKRGA